MHRDSRLQVIDRIRALTTTRPLRILSLCSDHERVTVRARLRSLLSGHVSLVAGPGSAACVCPDDLVYQAIAIALRHPATVLADDTLMRVRVAGVDSGPASLQEAAAAGADVRLINSPVEAQLVADADRSRDVVLFMAGFETLLAPLAGMLLEGVPDNLSLLLCGRSAEPLVDDMLGRSDADIDGLLLPGNRCAVTGLGGWAGIVQRHHCAAAVAGYTVPALLSGIEAIADEVSRGEAHITNCYRAIARPEGDPVAIDHFERLYERRGGRWRGLGAIDDSAFVLRRAYDVLNADHRFPDYRSELAGRTSDLPKGCECANVLVARRSPRDCTLYGADCTPESPRGPCMAASNGTCALQ